MTEGDLEAFVSRSRRFLNRPGSMSARTTELRIVLPLLQTLGWDVHGNDVVPEFEVDDVTVDFALQIDRTPAVFVVAASTESELGADRIDHLAEAMTAADVDWGIATNGRTYVLLTIEEDEPRQVEYDLDDLPDEGAALAHFTRSAAVERQERRASEVRTDVAETLAENRPAVVDAVQDALLPDDADAIDGEIRMASERFVEGVVSALDAGDRPASVLDAGTGEAPARDDAGTDPEDTTTGEGSPASRTGGESAAASTDDQGTEQAGPGSQEDGDIVKESTADTEYVVRFFNGRSSVGAVGHSTSGGAMAQAVEYMIEQHALDSRLNLPWGESNGRALLNYDPVHPDGSDMESPKQLSNGYFVETAVAADGSRAAVEELAEQSGLRVMFRGDWP